MSECLEVPIVVGCAQQGNVLIATHGVCHEIQSYQYQWVRFPESSGYGWNIQGASHQSYIVTADDVGSYLCVGVVAISATSLTLVSSVLTAQVKLAHVEDTQLLPQAIQGYTSLGAPYCT